MSVVLRSLLKVPQLLNQDANSGLKFIVSRMALIGPQLHTMAKIGSTASLNATRSNLIQGQVMCAKTCNCGHEQIAWAGVSLQSVRGVMRKHYEPSAWKRINKHGIEKRLLTESGIHVLWRRILKKRFNLAPFERILPGTVDGKILPKHQIPKVSRKEIEKIIKRR